MSFYTPIQSARAFRRGKRYDQIDWNNFGKVIEEFHGRIDDWYIIPTKKLISMEEGGHFVFPIMAMTCLLIDTLSQYYYGADKGSLNSSGAKFRDFLIDRLPHRTGLLPSPIKLPDGKRLTRFEEVLWSGFRCGILHEAHIPLYGALYGVESVIEFQANGSTKYSDGTDCPTVICFPQRLFDELETVFIKYMDDLLNPVPAFDDLRRRFKVKFENSFGVIISINV